MKRIVLNLLASLALGLWAENHGIGEADLYQAYMQDPSWENLQKAMEHYRTAGETDPEAEVMLAYLAVNELENALVNLDESKDTLSTRTLFSYANLLLELRKYDEAIPLYEKLNESAPKWSCPWRHKGEALMKSHRLADAEAATLMAIETRPDHFDAYIQLATIRKDMGHPAEALDALEQGLTFQDDEGEVNMTDVDFLHLELLKSTGKTQKYDALYKKLKADVPDDPRLQ